MGSSGEGVQGTMAHHRREYNSYNVEEKTNMILFCPFEYNKWVYIIYLYINIYIYNNITYELSLASFSSGY